MFRTPLSPSYWKLALSELRDRRKLMLAALLIALSSVIGMFAIPIGDNLNIFFTFVVKSLSALICGPVVALLSGFASDLVGFLVRPAGGFFPGYTLSTMMGMLLYALFLYRARITVLRIFLCKLSVNLFVNVFMGSLWSALLYGKGYYFYLLRSLTKNLLLLPIEVLLMVLFLRLMLPLVARRGLAPAQPEGRIPWF